MRESRLYGSVRGALSNERPYRDRRFAPRNDEGSLSPPVPPVAAADIGHPHQLRNHAHQFAAATAAEHAHEVAAAHVHAVTVGIAGAAAIAATETAGDAAAGHAAHTAKAAAAFHHLAHHRPHGLHHHAEAALAHLRFH